MNKTFIVLAAILYLGSAHAAGSWMFQSQANVSTSEGGVSTGNYTFNNVCDLESQSANCLSGEPYAGYIWVKWDKPLLFSGQAKADVLLVNNGTIGRENDTIPDSCINYDEDSIYMAFVSIGASAPYHGVLFACRYADGNNFDYSEYPLNQSVWRILEWYNTTAGGAQVKDPSYAAYAVDGNYSTAAAFSLDVGYGEWNKIPGSSKQMSIWDIGMWFFVNSTITPIYPTTSRVNLSENTTVDFTVQINQAANATTNVTWWKNAVLQFSEFVTGTAESVWSWVIGYQDSGEYNITVNASTDSFYWNVTVEDSFPVPDAPLALISTGGQFEYSIPLFCKIDFNPVAPYHFEFVYGVNNTTAATAMNINDSDGFVPFDISNDAYGSTYVFGCRVVSPSGTGNYTYSASFRKVNRNNFYLFRPKGQNTYVHGVPYDLGYVAELENDVGATITATLADCNGDGLWDYSWDLSDENATSSRENFACINTQGKVDTTIAMVIKKDNSFEWDALGCRDIKSSEKYCVIYKTYELTVQ